MIGNDETRWVNVLNDSEKSTIINVLLRNRALQNFDRQRRNVLFNSLSKAERLLSTSDYKRIILQACPLCEENFALIFSNGIVCQICELKICKYCQYFFHNNRIVLCRRCYRHILYEAKCGSWFSNASSFDDALDMNDLVCDSLEKLFRVLTDSERNHSCQETVTAKKYKEIQTGPKPKGIVGNMSYYASDAGMDFPEDSMVADMNLRTFDEDEVRSHQANVSLQMSTEADIPNYDSMNNEEKSMDEISGLSYNANRDNNTEISEIRSGEIEFAMDYDFRFTVFRVSIKRCRHLNASIRDLPVCNPFVKVCLLPDKTRAGRRKTKLKKNTNDPEFHEELKYFIDKSALESRTLLVSVWHRSEILTANSFLGEVSIPLAFYEFKSMEPQWYLLTDQSPNVIKRGNIVYRGDLNIAIKYVSSSNVNITDLGKLNSKGELLIWIKGAKNLTIPNPSRECNTVAKMYLLPDKSKLTKRKSPLARRTNDPKWNVILKYEDITMDDLHDKGLEISVWNHERFSSNTFIGGVRINLGPGDPERADIDWMDASGPEFRLWSGLLSRPDVWIDGSLPLRPCMD